MKWLLVAGIIFWNVAFVFAQNKVSDLLHKESGKKEPVTERLLMGGTEIQGTVEKPHVVYVVPWKDVDDAGQQGVPLERSFREEILEMVDYSRFQRKWGRHPRLSKGGEKK